MSYWPYDIIIIAKQIWMSLCGSKSCRGFFYAQMEVMCVGYRKVSYMEQIWYILRYKLQQLFRKEDKRAK